MAESIPLYSSWYITLLHFIASYYKLASTAKESIRSNGSKTYLRAKKLRSKSKTRNLVTGTAGQSFSIRDLIGEGSV